jgi:hypothetical protein
MIWLPKSKNLRIGCLTAEWRLAAENAQEGSQLLNVTH